MRLEIEQILERFDGELIPELRQYTIARCKLFSENMHLIIELCSLFMRSKAIFDGVPLETSIAKTSKSYICCKIKVNAIDDSFFKFAMTVGFVSTSLRLVLGAFKISVKFPS